VHRHRLGHPSAIQRVACWNRRLEKWIRDGLCAGLPNINPPFDCFVEIISRRSCRESRADIAVAKSESEKRIIR